MDNRAPTANPADRPLAPLGALRPAEVAELAQALIQTRQSTLPKRLAGPGPDAAQTQTILAAAASARCAPLASTTAAQMAPPNHG